MRRVLLGLVFAVVFEVFIGRTLPTAHSQVAEIPQPLLRGYAAATYTRQGQPVIYYNPRSIRQVGPYVASFIRAHEYGHIYLGHAHRPISRQQAEHEADLFAARNVSRRSVVATRRWFRAGNGGGMHHGSAYQRARRIAPASRLFR